MGRIECCDEGHYWLGHGQAEAARCQQGATTHLAPFRASRGRGEGRVVTPDAPLPSSFPSFITLCSVFSLTFSLFYLFLILHSLSPSLPPFLPSLPSFLILTIFSHLPFIILPSFPSFYASKASKYKDTNIMIRTERKREEGKEKQR